jgi:hypothetical protein
MAVHIEYEAKFYPLRGIPKKECFRNLKVDLPSTLSKSLSCNQHSPYSERRKITQFQQPPLAHFPNISTNNITKCSNFVQIQNFKTSQDGSISVISYSLDNRGIVVHIPLGARDLFLVQSIQTSSGINITFLFQEHQGSFAMGYSI